MNPLPYVWLLFKNECYEGNFGADAIICTADFETVTAFMLEDINQASQEYPDCDPFTGVKYTLYNVHGGEEIGLSCKEDLTIFKEEYTFLQKVFRNYPNL